VNRAIIYCRGGAMNDYAMVVVIFSAMFLKNEPVE
jgi:hypothetical protein